MSKGLTLLKTAKNAQDCSKIPLQADNKLHGWMLAIPETLENEKTLENPEAWNPETQPRKPKPYGS